MTISQQLRDHIEQSGITRADISRASGVAQSVLARFVNGETKIGLENIEKLVEFFELELQPKTKARRTKKRSK